MRSRDDIVEHEGAVAWALDVGLVAVGGRLDDPPGDLDEAVAAVRARHGDRVADRLERFADVADGSLVWTRDGDGELWRGEVRGAWRFDASATARTHDLQHVRPCVWDVGPVPLEQVPAAVLRTFERGGRNFQRVRAL